MSTTMLNALLAPARPLTAGVSVLRGVASLAGSVTRQAVSMAPGPGTVLDAAATLSRRAVAAVDTVQREARPAARSLGDVGPDREHRRVWSDHGHAHIEVRGLTGTGSTHRRVAADVTRRLQAMRGVRWAEINAVTGRVLVAFDEGRVDVPALLDTVQDVERARGTDDEHFSWSRPVHPSDPTPIAAAGAELAADCVSLATAVTARLVRLPAAPRGLRLAQALLEVERPLRKRLKHRVGPIGTDVILALSAAAVHGLSQQPIGPAVDVLYRLELLAEAVARRTAWERRTADLCGGAGSGPAVVPERPPRPVPRPDGPIEEWSRKLGPGALAAAGVVLGLTRDPGRAAEAIQVAVPRAARLGREGFATTVGRELAGRGVVALNAAAWRRLDRVNTVVIDSAALCNDRPQILSVEPAGSVRPGTVWRAASAAVDGRSMTDLAGDDGPWTCDTVRLDRDSDHDEPGALAFVLRRGNRRLGRITVGHELDPLADALVDAARATGARTLLTSHASVVDVVPRADDVLAADRPLAAQVQALQRDGADVLVLSDTDDAALAVADVGVAILGRPACGPWSADLVCGPGLHDAWRILRATAAARPVSERAVRLAQAGSALGELLALVGGGRGRPTHSLLPVYGAAATALAHGTVAGLIATRRGAPVAVPHVPWHAMDPTAVLSKLDGRRAAAPEPPTPRPWWAAADRIGVGAAVRGAARFAGAVREELDDPLTPVLAVGAAASSVVGSGVDTVLVAAVMAGNALISGAQRIGAERALHRLFLEQEIDACRLRGRPSTIDSLSGAVVDHVAASELVPGDVVALQVSDVVPADARLLSSAGLEVDESTLTGESLPAEKSVDATPGAPFGDRSCLVYEGTTVVAGTGYAVVVATGSATAAGRAVSAAGRAAPSAGLQTQLARITATALPATGVGGAAVAILALVRGLRLREAVAAGVSVAVAAVPEGLPLVATVAQAAAARRLSAHGVLVRSSRTLEALGRVDVLCFDKTGTLTEGRLTVARLVTGDGDGNGELDPADPYARRLLTAAARACPDVPADELDTVPHATDRAVLDAAHRSGDVDHRRDWRLSAELPFETNRGYAAALGAADDTAVLVVKGAPEVVLPRCRTLAGPRDDVELTPERTEALHGRVDRLAADGLRVLAVAERTGELPTDGEISDDTVTDLTLLGLVGVADTPRPDAADALRRITDDGIRMIMVTGDHPATAAAIARAVGMPADRVLTGADLDEMPRDERIRVVADTSIFARVSPDQKLRIVEALQDDGKVVAMTGDGTNDAAAIRLADIGIGLAGADSSAARTAADLVLAEVDIGHLYEAILEGRALWQRVGEAVSILVGGNAGEVAFMVLGTALGGRAPIGVRQMLLVNMLTDMFPALAVAVSPAGGHRHLGSSATDVMGRRLAHAIAIRGGATALGALAAWTIGRYTGRSARASSMGLAAVVGTQLGQTILAGRHSRLVVLTAVASAAALVAIIETPGISQFFGCTPIGPIAWTVVATAAVAGTTIAALAARYWTVAPHDDGVSAA
jgi:cation-transporting ATPase I